MHFSALSLLTLIPSLSCAAPASQFNRTEWQEYHCLTLERYLTKIAPPCAVNCLSLGLGGGRDGCPPDDHVCHCAHTQAADDIIFPCISTPGGVNATCNSAEIDQAVSIVNNLCTFYNATHYEDYTGCAPQLTLELLNENLGIL
ncbi:hypothetical protein EV356DRAFT_513180 [Viridothelium virens]|uniref:CFEM domain-containing protein n=1 Tax=Viridothelium virens TaxID=1048519 RepID=A0A6A6HEJ1_VIRVR|nr:hypothetical protein EV356DRAFT_513180 [Viridothelium virens]